MLIPSRRPVSLYLRCLPHRPGRKANHSRNTPYPSRRRAALLFHRRRRFIRNGVTPPPQVTYQSVPVPNRIQRKVFTRNEGKQGTSLPYIPSGSFAKAMLIEGRMPMPQSPVMNPRCRCSCVSPARWKCRTARRMTQRDVLWGWKHGDVSSERAIVRTRNISCLKDGKTIDMPIKGMSASG